MTLSMFGDFAILKKAIYLDAEKTLNTEDDAWINYWLVRAYNRHFAMLSDASLGWARWPLS